MPVGNRRRALPQHSPLICDFAHATTVSCIMNNESPIDLDAYFARIGYEGSPCAEAP